MQHTCVSPHIDAQTSSASTAARHTRAALLQMHQPFLWSGSRPVNALVIVHDGDGAVCEMEHSVADGSEQHGA